MRLYHKKVKADTALHENPISELRDVTCHMGSHSVTCHPTQVNAPRLSPAMEAGKFYLPLDIDATTRLTQNGVSFIPHIFCTDYFYNVLHIMLQRQRR